MVDQSQSRFWGWIGAIVAAILVIWGIAAIWGDRKEKTTFSEVPPATEVSPDTSTPSSSESTTSTAGSVPQAEFIITEESELNDNPDKYAGAKITVDGAVSEVIGTEKRLFTLDTDGKIEGSEVLVITKAGGPATSEPGGKITVVGIGRKLQPQELAALEAEVGYSIDPDLIAGYEKKIVIIADSVAAH
jgi:hypothetical protein